MFANGIVATLATSRVAAAAERSIAVTEEGRRLVANLAAPELTIIAGAEGGVAAERIALAPRDNLAAEIDAFLTSVASGAPPPVDGQAGLDALTACPDDPDCDCRWAARGPGPDPWSARLMTRSVLPCSPSPMTTGSASSTCSGSGRGSNPTSRRGSTRCWRTGSSSSGRRSRRWKSASPPIPARST